MISVDIHLHKSSRLKIDYFPKSEKNEEFWVVEIMPDERFWGDTINIYFPSIKHIDELIKALQELKKMGGKK